MTDSEKQDVRLEREGFLATLVIDRPESRNGLTPETCATLAGHLKAVAQDEGVRALVLTGAGDSFCAGLDMKEAAGSAFGGGKLDLESAIRDGFHAVVRALAALPQPSIARIGGHCVGFGFDMALNCDIRVGVRETKYGSVFSRIGLMPDGGGTYNLQRLVGVGKAMELVLTGQTYDGEEAQRLGVLNHCVADHAALDDLVSGLVESIVTKAPLAIRAAKKAIRAAVNGDLNEALDREMAGQLALLQTEDTMAAMMSFFTKQAPEFKGK